MRIRGWLGAMVLVAASAGVGGCRRDRVPPQTPPTPRTVDTSNMGRAGFPAQQGIPTGNSGEGIGGSGTSAGEGSAVKELKPGVPINVGVPGERSSEGKAAPPQDRR